MSSTEQREQRYPVTFSREEIVRRISNIDSFLRNCPVTAKERSLFEDERAVLTRALDAIDGEGEHETPLPHRKHPICKLCPADKCTAEAPGALVACDMAQTSWIDAALAGELEEQKAPKQPEQAGETVTHELKCWPEYFEDIFRGRKRFEIRKRDRDYKEGDILHLREYDDREGNEVGYSGREIMMRVTYCLINQLFMPEGYVAMSIEPLAGDTTARDLATIRKDVDEVWSYAVEQDLLPPGYLHTLATVSDNLTAILARQTARQSNG